MTGVEKVLFKNIWFDDDHGIARCLYENNQILRRESVEILGHEEDYELIRDLKILKGEIIAPLSHQGELLGFISLGKRISGVQYSQEDIELLALISVYTGIAVNNALDYQRVNYSKVCSESILKNIRTGIIAIDTEARITSINPFAEKLLKLDAQRIIGEEVQKAGSVMADLLLRTLQNHSLYVHHEVRDPMSKATISVSTSLLRDEEGGIIGVIAFFTDLSEIKELQSKIEDLRRVEFWSELSARMAHEIRNPLTSIKTFTQLFPERYDDPEFRENFVQIVGKEIDKIDSITEQLVTYSKPFRGDVKPVEINSLIDETIISLGKTIREKKITVKKTTGPEVIRAVGNRDMLRGAFSRVLENAVDFADEGSEIRVSAEVLTLSELTQRRPAAVISDTIPTDIGAEPPESTHYIEIEVRDTGAGIPEENFEKVLTPFFSTKIKGIGLGLAIVDKTLQLHRGRVELDSRVDEGTSVRLIIPAYHEE
jgi:PAS domain S-box-containing protein